MWFGGTGGDAQSSERIENFNTKVKDVLQNFTLEGQLKKRGEKGAINSSFSIHNRSTCNKLEKEIFLVKELQIALFKGKRRSE
jgi:hypothetical protein